MLKALNIKDLKKKKFFLRMGFETCGPNEAMVVSGCGYPNPLMIPGGRVWVWPVVQRIQARLFLQLYLAKIFSSITLAQT